MSYRDEELLRMRQKMEAFKNEQTAENTIEEECKQSIHGPVDFEPMPQEIIDQVFMLQSKPQYVYETPYLPLGLAFTITDVVMDEQILQQIYPYLLSTLKKVGPGVRVISTEVGVNSILIPDEGGLIVIIDELKRIKAFGSLMESTITKKDITKKECELGFKLPEALCDLYEIFNPNDPIFSVWLSLVPLEHLSIRVIERELPHTYSCVSFLVNESASYGFAAKYHYSRTGELAQDYMLQEDPPVCSYFTFPKNKKQGMRLNVEEVLLSAMIVSCLGFLQVYTQPSLIGFNDDSSMVSQIELKELWKPFNCFANFDNYNFSVKDSETKSDILATSHLICPISISKYGNAFGAKTDEPLNKLIEENPNLEFVWLRSQSGSNIKEERVFSVPEWRELISIEPILQYLCDFAGLSEKGIVAEIIQKREEKIGGMLPISLKEYYQYMPTSFYHAYNYLRPLQKIKPTKDGKINFLEENQGIYYCAAEVNSPFVYQREKRWGGRMENLGNFGRVLSSRICMEYSCQQ